MAASISTSILLTADDFDNAKVNIGSGNSPSLGITGNGPIPSFDFCTPDGSRLTVQGYHTDPHDFAFAIRHLGDRLVQAADDWAQAQTEGGEQS